MNESDPRSDVHYLGSSEKLVSHVYCTFYVSFPLSVSFYMLYFLGKHTLFTKTSQQ